MTPEGKVKAESLDGGFVVTGIWDGNPTFGKSDA